jgi:hypothetical protein
VGKYGGAGQAKDDTVKGRRIDAIYLLDNSDKNTDTHSQYLIPIDFHGSNGYATLLNVMLYVTLIVLSDTRLQASHPTLSHSLEVVSGHCYAGCSNAALQVVQVVYLYLI